MKEILSAKVRGRANQITGNFFSERAAKVWPNSGYATFSFRSYSGFANAIFWPNFGHTKSIFWPNFGHTKTIFRSHFGHTRTTFRSHFGHTRPMGISALSRAPPWKGFVPDTEKSRKCQVGSPRPDSNPASAMNKTSNEK